MSQLVRRHHLSRRSLLLKSPSEQSLRNIILRDKPSPFIKYSTDYCCLLGERIGKSQCLFFDNDCAKLTVNNVTNKLMVSAGTRMATIN